jgi:hypothetical protein
MKIIVADEKFYFSCSDGVGENPVANKILGAD